MATTHARIEARVARLLDGGDLGGAAAETLHAYGPEILGYLVAVLRDEAAGEDVFSQFSEDLWKGMRRFRRECSMRTWCYRLAWEASKRYLRDPYRRRGRRLRTGDWTVVAGAVRERTAPYLRSTAKGKLHELRQRLRRSEQTLLTLRIDRGLTWAEISQVMRSGRRPLEETTLRKRYERLKVKLRRMAEADGLLSADE